MSDESTPLKGLATDGRSARAEQLRSARREAIVRAAEAVFARHGFHNASISDVIEAAEISRGTFYLYFESKEQLFVRLIERFVGLVTGVLHVVDPRAPQPEQRILENVARVVDVVFDHPQLTRVVLSESRGRNPELDEQLDRLYEFLGEMVQGALVNGEKSGLARSVNAKVVSTALIGAFKEVFLSHLARAGREGVPHAERAALADALFDLSVRGLLVGA